MEGFHAVRPENVVEYRDIYFALENEGVHMLSN